MAWADPAFVMGSIEGWEYEGEIIGCWKVGMEPSLRHVLLHPPLRYAETHHFIVL